MAFGIESVVQVKEFDISQQALTGDAIFRVCFFYDTLDELSDYPALAFLAMTAVDPVTSLAIPVFQSVLSGDIDTFVEDISPVINKNQQSEWLVTVNYAPPDVVDSTTTVSTDPTTEEETFDWVEVLENEKIWRDANNVPILTSSGGGFTSLPQVANAYLSCTVSRNKSAYDPDDALSVINRINDDTFSIDGNSYDAGFVKCKGWRGKKRTVTVAGSGTVVYHSESLIFLIKDEVWLGRVFDQDTFSLSAIVAGKVASGRLRIKGKGKKEVTSPVPLNGAGLPIFEDGSAAPVHLVVDVAYDPVAGTPGVEGIGTPTRAAMLTFQFWKEADFSITGVT